MRQKIYQSPVIKVVKFQIESGFAGSPLLTPKPAATAYDLLPEDQEGNGTYCDFEFINQ